MTTLKKAIISLKQKVLNAIYHADCDMSEPFLDQYLAVSKRGTANLIIYELINWAFSKSPDAKELKKTFKNEADLDDAIESAISSLRSMFMPGYLIAEYAENNGGKRLINVKQFYCFDDAYAYEQSLKDSDNIVKAVSYSPASILTDVCYQSEYYSKGEGSVDIIIAATFSVDGERQYQSYEFNVQTLGGVYMPQMGCLISIDGKCDGSLSEDEGLFMTAFDVSGIAENAMDDFETLNTTYYSTRFNTALSGNEAFVRELDGKFTIVIIDNAFNRNDYATPIYISSTSFDSLDDAFQYIDQFRGNDFSDAEGLAKLMGAIQEDIH